MNEGEDTLRVADPDSAPYFEGLERGALLLQRCAACLAAQFPPRCMCTACGNRDLAWFEASGRGRIYSFTVCHRGGSDDDPPFMVALVDLDEGVRVLARKGTQADELSIGTAVRTAVGRAPGNGYTLVFSLVGDDS